MQKYQGCRFVDAVRFLDSVSLILFGIRLFDFYGRESTADEVIGGAFFVGLEGAESLISKEQLYLLEKKLLLDAESIFLNDPAANSVQEVIRCYPGFYAIFCHRIAHNLYLEGVPILPRLISEYAHSLTGIDIHPGATIGESFSIDHGTGIVIGETAEIGCGVTMYHGVTLGARTVRSKERKKRHPTVEDGCLICANAQIFGGDTVIGRNSVIGAGVRIAHSVPPGTIISYKNGEKNEQ